MPYAACMDDVPADHVPEAETGARGEGRPGGVRGILRRLAASKAELEAEDLRASTDAEGAVPIAGCGERIRAKVAGTLRTVTLRPRGGVPSLEAELYDGSDVISLIWLGRRKITGIEPGRRLRAEGLISVQDGRKVMFNPRYELRGHS